MGPSDRNVLEVQGLTVRFDTSERSVVAVKDLGFHVRAGEVLAIVGESGSGKSVTSLSVMRLIEHGGGTIASGKISFTRRNGGKLDLAKAADSVMRTIRGGRRTDDSARRDHSGADPPAHPAAAGRDGHGGHLHHPRHGRGGGGR